MEKANIIEELSSLEKDVCSLLLMIQSKSDVAQALGLEGPLSILYPEDLEQEAYNYPD